jgi:hypothetical protein
VAERPEITAAGAQIRKAKEAQIRYLNPPT